MRSMTPFEHTVLHTGRLRLRPLQDDDAESLLAMFGNPRVARYLSQPAWLGLEQARASIERSRAAMASGESLRLGLALPGQPGVIGEASLFSFHAVSRRAELGYVMAQGFWGHGYMHEALQALVGHAFGALGLNRLEADIDPRNTASARSLERLGFVREGFLRERWIVAGEVSDTALYGLIQRDWAQRA